MLKGASPLGIAASQLGTNTALFQLLGANLNSTADQAFSKAFSFTRFTIEKIIATNASGAITTAAGGIYSGAGKTGTIIVSAAQLWTGLTSTVTVFNPPLTAAGQNLLTIQTLYLSLTTPMGSAGTCDIFVLGEAW